MGKPLNDYVPMTVVYERIMEITGLSTYVQLAEYIGASHQALSASKIRGSIAIGALLEYVKLAKSKGHPKASLDYIVYGIVSPGAVEAQVNTEVITPATEPVPTEQKQIIVDVERIGGGTIPFPRELLSQGVDESKLRAYLRLDRWLLIDTADSQVTDGEFVFGDMTRPVIRKCESQIDGSVAIEGLDKPQSSEDLKKLPIVGRVIWKWQATA